MRVVARAQSARRSRRVEVVVVRIVVEACKSAPFGVSLRLLCECQCTLATSARVAPLSLGCRASQKDPL